LSSESHSHRVKAAKELAWDDEALHALLLDRSEEVVLTILRRPDFPPALYAKLPDLPPPAVRLFLAKVEPLEEARLLRLSRDLLADVRKRMAQRRTLSAEHFDMLANDSEVLVKRELAQRDDCPASWLQKWSLDPSEWLRRAALANHRVTSEVLAKASVLADNHREIAEHLLTPTEILTRLADSQDVFVRGAVAKNPNTPENVLSQLARDADSFPRLNVASNKVCPLSLLRELENDPDFVVRRHVV